MIYAVVVARRATGLMIGGRNGVLLNPIWAFDDLAEYEETHQRLCKEGYRLAHAPAEFVHYHKGDDFFVENGIVIDGVMASDPEPSVYNDDYKHADIQVVKAKRQKKLRVIRTP